MNCNDIPGELKCVVLIVACIGLTIIGCTWACQLAEVEIIKAATEKGYVQEYERGVGFVWKKPACPKPEAYP